MIFFYKNGHAEIWPPWQAKSPHMILKTIMQLLFAAAAAAAEMPRCPSEMQIMPKRLD